MTNAAAETVVDIGNDEAPVLAGELPDEAAHGGIRCISR
jgi:hypothetical protein